VINRGGAAYWMPAFAGMTAVLCLHAMPFHTPSNPSLRKYASNGSSGRPRMVK
jgi:hypothetical protein